MNSTVLKDLVDKALARAIVFPEILAALKAQQVEAYHVDLLRREYRFYDRDGQSLVMADLERRKVRYFGRNGEESIQYFPGSSPAAAEAPTSRSRAELHTLRRVLEKPAAAAVP